MTKHYRALERQTELEHRTREIIKRLTRKYPDAETALHHARPLELLVATILSAQCTDARVNIVTKELFQRYRSAADYATANLKELEGYIRSTGFYHAKARNIIGCCTALMDRHGGRVPDSMEELVALPGVGRKTANVVLGSAFGKAAGIVVDTHVKRLSDRLGLTKHADPEKVEADLVKLVPKRSWIVFSHLLIHHGRNTCQARKPACPECVVRKYCPSAGKFSLP